MHSDYNNNPFTGENDFVHMALTENISEDHGMLVETAKAPPIGSRAYPAGYGYKEDWLGQLCCVLCFYVICGL